MVEINPVVLYQVSDRSPIVEVMSRLRTSELGSRQGSNRRSQPALFNHLRPYQPNLLTLLTCKTVNNSFKYPNIICGHWGTSSTCVVCCIKEWQSLRKTRGQSYYQLLPFLSYFLNQFRIRHVEREQCI